MPVSSEGLCSRSKIFRRIPASKLVPARHASPLPLIVLGCPSNSPGEFNHGFSGVGRRVETRLGFSFIELLLSSFVLRYQHLHRQTTFILPFAKLASQSFTLTEQKDMDHGNLEAS